MGAISKDFYKEMATRIANNEDKSILQLLHYENPRNLIDRPPLKEKNINILVEGNIGAGKSCLVRALAEYENVTLVEEPVEEWRHYYGNNMLEMYYDNPRRYATSFQIMVLDTVSRQLVRHRESNPKPVSVFERSAYSSRYVFTEQLHAEGKISHLERMDIDETFHRTMKEFDLEDTDLIIYVKTDWQVAYDRIRARDRYEERRIGRIYIEDLSDLHDEWLIQDKWEIPCPVLIVDGNKEMQQVHAAVQGVCDPLFGKKIVSQA